MEIAEQADETSFATEHGTFIFINKGVAFVFNNFKVMRHVLTH